MGLINKIGALFGAAGNGNPVLKRAFSAIEEALGPQLLALSDSRERLEPAVIQALTYFREAAGAIPGPVDLASGRYTSDPRVQALFPAVEAIGEGLGRSMALRDALGWFSDHGRETVHAVLGLRLGTPDPVTGRASPADHTFRSLGIDDPDTRECLAEAAFAAFVKGFAADLKEQQREWRLQHTEKRLQNELEGGSDEPIDLHLAKAGDRFTLGRMQEALIERLGQPERQLRIEAASPSVLVPATATGESPFHLPQLVGVDRRRWLVCTVSFPLLDAVNAVAREPRAHRYILI